MACNKKESEKLSKVKDSAMGKDWISHVIEGELVRNS